MLTGDSMYVCANQLDNLPFMLPHAAGTLLMPRLEAAQQPAHLAHTTSSHSLPSGMTGSVLVSGGLGDIGRLAGQWVAAAAPRSHVWLLGRSGRAAHSMSSALAHQLGHISMAAVDVAVASDTNGLLGQLTAVGAPAVSGLLHAGAVLQDALLRGQTAASLRAVHAPKVTGALRLAGAAAAMPLQGAVQFSSLSALLGTPGQSNYAATNAALDGLAQEW